ncbi:oligosaccharide flippase family protein [bacterium]|nr:oligosaccharide flippase family protein [bacterium]
MIYGFADVLNKALAFALIPLYTRILSPGDYGALQIFVIVANIGYVVVQMGLSSAIFKSVLYHENADKPVIISTSFYCIVLLSIVFLIPCFMYSKILSHWIFGSDLYIQCFKILMITIFFRSFNVIPLAALRIENESVTFSIFIVSSFLVQLAMNIFFVLVLKMGLMGILTAECISAGIFAVIYFIFLFNRLVLKFSLSELKELLEFGIPLVPAALAMFVLTMSDRFFIKHFYSLEDVGFYSIGYRFGMIIGILVGAFQKAWPSAMFSIARQENAKRVFSENFTRFLAVLFTLTLGLTLFSKEVFLIMATKTYIPGIKIIPYIALSFIFYGIYYYCAIGMNLKKKTYYQALIVTAAAGINIFFNWLLIPRFGIQGAAFATLISFVFMGVVANMISQHYYFVTYKYAQITVIIVIFLLFAFISNYLSNLNYYIGIFSKFILFILYVGICYHIGFRKKVFKQFIG